MAYLYFFAHQSESDNYVDSIFFVFLQDTDYNATYFDNGENYGADEDDDLDEGAIYS